MKTSARILALVLSITAVVRSGPNTWAHKYPKCGGTHQSPIDVLPFTAYRDPGLGLLNFEGSEQSVGANLQNNGHTIVVTPWAHFTLQEVSVPNTFILSSFHFHFGNRSGCSMGSEHQVNGEAYPMEMHLVFSNSKYKSIKEAMAHYDGLAVLGVLFEIGAPNEGLKPITQALPKVKYNGQSTPVTVNLYSLLPQELSPYYRYQGSLTTPQCSENVIWTLLSSPLQMSWMQYHHITSQLFFTGPNESHSVRMCNNFRPVQPLNGRQTLKQFPFVPLIFERIVACSQEMRSAPGCLESPKQLGGPRLA
ncbi:carbonic anhydrase-like [Latimeria chalumnae]|uniref:carbonic anhydrase-like n=1 Tax=Latimeria chalumnae TaxID=7897 RepID=UPI00313EF8FB